jgi:1-acyl-sn-glycerol-3-phosphate acyltransferase
MAKEEIFRVPLLKFILPYLKCFPVKRGKADRNALRTALKHLASGEIIGIFPEGTRNKGAGLLPFEQGSALIAIKAGAPIIPIGFIGTKKAFPASLRGNIEVRIGKPLYYPELEGAKLTNEDLDRVNKEIIESIKTLILD